MNVLFMTPEYYPFAKSGGLAEVAEAITVNLVRKGLNVTVCVPYYKQVSQQKFRISGKISKIEIDPPEDCLKFFNNNIDSLSKKKIADELRFFDILPYKYKGVNILFIKNDYLFNRDFLYSNGSIDYEDNLLRFAFFNYASLVYTSDNMMKFDIIHCNDWQTSLIPALVKFKFKLPAKTLLTIHNLGYQGLFPAEQFRCTFLSKYLLNIEGFEYFGKINLLKGGIEFADVVTTVSKKYALEIQTKEYGFGLEGVLETGNKKLHGILNGVDYDEWNPEADKYLAKNFAYKNYKTGKKSCKKDLLNIFFGKDLILDLMDKPVIGIIARLDEQKGFNILIEAIPEIIKNNAVIIILGTGNSKIEKELKKIADAYPQNVGLKIEYNNHLAHKIEAGSDFYVMPSKYEPCGLNQMYSLIYGTVPIVRGTGGLDDTIINFDGINIGESNGFKFYDFNGEDLIKTVNYAISLYYNDKNTMAKLISNGMKSNFSWEKSINEYIDLYNEII
jgi:starch synthase